MLTRKGKTLARSKYKTQQYTAFYKLGKTIVMKTIEVWHGCIPKAKINISPKESQHNG